MAGRSTQSLAVIAAVETRGSSIKGPQWFVLVIAAVTYGLAAIVYFQAPADYVVGVIALAAVGTVFLGLFLFGSTRACEAAATILSLGWWP